MPKMKSHSGTKDRFRVTKTGKVMSRKSGRNHFLQGKSSARKRTFDKFNELTGKQTRTIKKNLSEV